MISYDIEVLPLIWGLRGAHPRVTQLWYADDTGAGRKSEHIQAHLWDLLVRVPPRGYYLE